MRLHNKNIFFLFSLCPDQLRLIPGVQSEPGLLLRAGQLLRDSHHLWSWKASAQTMRAVNLIMPSNSLPHTNTHVRARTHTYHLHKLFKWTKEAKLCYTNCLQTRHPINPGRNSADKQDYVIPKGCQYHALWEKSVQLIWRGGTKLFR